MATAAPGFSDLDAIAATPLPAGGALAGGLTHWPHPGPPPRTCLTWPSTTSKRHLFLLLGSPLPKGTLSRCWSAAAHTELIRVDGVGPTPAWRRSMDGRRRRGLSTKSPVLGRGNTQVAPAIEAAARPATRLRFRFPRARVPARRGFYPYDFSFSGSKTAVLRLTQKLRTGRAQAQPGEAAYRSRSGRQL